MDLQNSPLAPGPRYREGEAYRIKAALFDVDNTLVGNESADLPSEKFRQAVTTARGKISVGLISARPLSKVSHILDFIDANGLSVLCNGAQIINNTDRSIIAEWTLNPKTCADLAAYVRTLGVKYWINDDGVDYFEGADGVSYEKQVDIWNPQGARIAVSDYAPAKPFVVVAHDTTEQQVAAIKEFTQSHTDKNIVASIAHESKQASGSMLYDLFIMHRQADKSHALRDVARRQGLSIDEIMIVGDGRNDASVVSEAGVGVAMGNAAQETLAVATFIAANREADGAASALEFAAAKLL